MTFAELAIAANATARATFGTVSVVVTDAAGGNSQTLAALVHESRGARMPDELGRKDAYGATFKFAAATTGLVLDGRITYGGRTYAIREIDTYAGEIACRAEAIGAAEFHAQGASRR